MAKIDRKRVRELFEGAIDLPAEERGAFVEASAHGEPEVLAEVRSLLGALEAADEFQTAPPTGDGRAETREEAGFSGNGVHRSEMPMRSIGPYRLLERIGEGGFGDVFLAEQERPVRRRVALKLVKLGMDTRRVIARFEQERQALAMMDHPNIARVLDAGATVDGRPYFVMELVRGEPITAFCDRQRLGVRERLELFKSVCEAVQHAHQKGIIHRDIKPSNVLVALSDVGGGRPVAKVIDFGIAKATGEPLTDKTLFTEHRQLIGTPEYMSPEQAEMTAVDVDTRSDVYSLGVLLYELLTGTTPIDGKTLRGAAFAEMLRLIRETDPPRPSTRVRTLARTAVLAGGAASGQHERAKDREGAARPGPGQMSSLGASLRGELDWIVMKAIEKDRTRRYDTASGLAADLQRFLDGRSVEAGPPGAIYRVQTMVRRNRVAVGAAAAVSMALLVGLGLAIAGYVTASRDRDAARAAQLKEADSTRIAREERAQAESARDAARLAGALADERKAQAERRLYRSALAAASAAVKENNPGPGLISLRSIAPEQRGWEWRVLERLADRATATARLEPTERVSFMWPMRDPARAAAWLSEPAPALAIISVGTGEVIRRFPGIGALSPDDKWVAMLEPVGVMAPADGRSALELVVRQVATGAEHWRVGPSEKGTWSIGAASFSTDSASLVAMDGSGDLIFFDVATGSQRRVHPDPAASAVVGFVELGTGGTEPPVLYESRSGITLLDPNTGKSGRDFEFFYSLLPNRAYSGMGHAIATLRKSSRIVAPKTGLEGAHTYCDIALDGRMLVNADGLGGVALTDVAGGELLAPASWSRFPGAGSWISHVSFNGNAEAILVTTRNGGASFVPVDAGAAAFAVRKTAPGFGVLSPDRSRVVRIGWGHISVFDTLAGLPIWSKSISGLPLTCAAWSPDGSRIAVASAPRAGEEPRCSELYVMDAESGRQVLGLGRSAVLADPTVGLATPGWTGDIESLVFSADGKRLLLARADGSMRAIDTGAWQPLEQPLVAPVTESRPGAQKRLAMSRDGVLLAQIAPRATGSDGQYSSVSFPGRFAGGVGGAARLEWVVNVREATTLRERSVLGVAGMTPTSVAFAAEGSDLFVGYADGSIVRWDTASAKEIWRSEPVAERATAIAVSPDGTRLVGCFEIAEGVVLDARTGEVLAGLPVPEASVHEMAFTADGATLVLSSWYCCVARLDTVPLAAPLPAAVAALWPKDLPVPATLLAARSLVMRATETIPQVTVKEAGVGAARREIEAAGEAPPPVRAMATAILDRMGLPLRECNNAALILLLKAEASPVELRRAAGLLAELVKAYPNDAPIHLNLGTAMFRLQEYREAAGMLERGLAILAERGRPPYVQGLYMLAISQRELGNRAEAERWLAQARTEAEAQKETSDAAVRALAARIGEFQR